MVTNECPVVKTADAAAWAGSGTVQELRKAMQERA